MIVLTETRSQFISQHDLTIFFWRWFEPPPSYSADLCPPNWGNRVVPCLSLSHFRLRLRIAVVCVMYSSKIVTNCFLYRDITKFLVKAFYLNSPWLWRQSFSVVRLRKRLRRLEVPASWLHRQSCVQIIKVERKSQLGVALLASVLFWYKSLGYLRLLLSIAWPYQPML